MQLFVALSFSVFLVKIEATFGQSDGQSATLQPFCRHIQGAML
jgi:hypothetical protein